MPRHFYPEIKDSNQNRKFLVNFFLPIMTSGANVIWVCEKNTLDLMHKIVTACGHSKLRKDKIIHNSRGGYIKKNDNHRGV